MRNGFLPPNCYGALFNAIFVVGVLLLCSYWQTNCQLIALHLSNAFMFIFHTFYVNVKLYAKVYSCRVACDHWTDLYVRHNFDTCKLRFLLRRCSSSSWVVSQPTNQPGRQITSIKTVGRRNAVGTVVRKIFFKKKQNLRNI